jgi:long-subunit fatty acid transport protein
MKHYQRLSFAADKTALWSGCIGLLALIILLLLDVGVVHAQSKTGTTVGQFLLIEPSARSAAMGNAGVASFDEVMSAYYNPGALGRLSGSGVQFTHSQWLADITYDHASAAVHIGADATLLLSVTSLNSGEIDVRTVEQPLGTGERYTVSNIAVGLGYGQTISDRFSVGVRVNYIQETIWHSSLSTVAIDLGTLYRLAPDGLHVGASISNFGFRARYSGRDLRIRYDLDPTKYGDNSALPGEVFTDEYSLPVLFRVGIALPVKVGEDHNFRLEVDAFHPSDNTESISLGAEWTFMDIFSLRGGYQNLFLTDSEVGPTFGAGVRYEVLGYLLRFDYAWAKHGRLGNAQRFTVGFEF